MDSEQSPNFGPLLRKFRLSRGLSQEALAELARVSTEAIGALERGNRKLPHRQTLALLIDALELEEQDRALLEAAAVKPPTPRRRSQWNGDTSEEGAVRSNLPCLLTHFVGRDVELRSLQQLVSERHLVTIIGAGGVGKTRTAIQVSTPLVEQYRDGAWLVELAPLRDPSLIPQAIASALEIREIPGSELLKAITATLRTKKLLLIVDNCEHVLNEAARVIETLLNECAGVTVLATSRQPLRVKGEALFRLPALVLPEESLSLNADSALEFAAVELFVQCASAVDPSFAITDKNAPTIASICRHIDGIPFAIELAASKVAALSVAQIAQYLKYRFTLLAGGTRTALPRQQTLRALIDWSYDLLAADERVFLARLSIFRGSFDAEAAASVGTEANADESDALRLLIALVEKSLVVSELGSDGEKRFRLLESTREYAQERLTESGQYDQIAQRHALHVLMFARAISPAFGAQVSEDWLNTVIPEIENIRGAIEWALAEENDVALGAEVAARFAPFWESRSYAEGKRYLTAARNLISRLDASLAARVLLEWVRILPVDEEALDISESAVNAYRELQDSEGLYHALEYRALTLINAARYEEASAVSAEAEALCPPEINAVSAAHLAAIQGFGDLYQRKLDQAFEHFVRADSFIRGGQHLELSALITRGFAEVALAKRDSAEAVELFSEALELAAGTHNMRKIGSASYQLAHGLLYAGRIEEAYTLACSAIHDLIDALAPPSFFEAVMVCAAICQARGNLERAARLLGFVNKRITSPQFQFGFLIEELRAGTSCALEASIEHSAYAKLLRDGAQLDELGILSEICYGSRTPSKI